MSTVPEIDACDCLAESCPVCLLSGKVKFARLSEPRNDVSEPEPEDEPIEVPVKTKRTKPKPKSLFD